MKKYRVDVDWSGYSRGIATYEVEAESEEEAKKFIWSGKETFRETIRDDTETEVTLIEEIV